MKLQPLERHTHILWQWRKSKDPHIWGQSTTLLKTDRGGRGTNNICLSEVSWILPPTPGAHSNSPTTEMLSLPFRHKKPGAGPCFCTPLQSPPECQGLDTLNGMGSYKASSQGPHWGHCPSSPWLVYVPLGDLSDCRCIPPRVTVCALRRYFLSESQVFTHLPPSRKHDELQMVGGQSSETDSVYGLWNMLNDTRNKSNGFGPIPTGQNHWRGWWIDVSTWKFASTGEVDLFRDNSLWHFHMPQNI